MVSTLFWSGFVNMASHPTSVQSSELIMNLIEKYVIEEKVIKSVIG